MTAEILRNFIETLGYDGIETTVEQAFLDHQCREVFNKTALRRMAVLDPVRVVITNYTEGKTELLPAVNNPEKPE